MIVELSGKSLGIRNIPGPQGVRGRNSQNDLIKNALGWAPDQPLLDGLKRTYTWIEDQVKAVRGRNHA